MYVFLNLNVKNNLVIMFNLYCITCILLYNNQGTNTQQQEIQYIELVRKELYQISQDRNEIFLEKIVKITSEMF